MTDTIYIAVIEDIVIRRSRHITQPNSYRRHGGNYGYSSHRYMKELTAGVSLAGCQCVLSASHAFAKGSPKVVEILTYSLDKLLYII